MHSFAGSGMQPSRWKAGELMHTTLRVSPRSTLLRCVGLYSSGSSALRAQRAGATSQLVNHLLAGRALTDCCFQVPAQTPAASNEASLAGMKRPCWPLDAANSFFHVRLPLETSWYNYPLAVVP